MSNGTTGSAHSGPVHICLADTDVLFRSAFQDATLAAEPHAKLSFFDDFATLRKTLNKQPHPSLIIVDPVVNGLGGIRGVLALHAVAPATPFVIATHHPNPSFIGNAMRFGASGFIGKSLKPNEMAKALTALLTGAKVINPPVVIGPVEEAAAIIHGRYDTLTRQQARVLGFLADGLLNKQIAYELGVSEATVKAHVSAILLKMDVPSRGAAVAAITSVSNPSALGANF
jgi:DNA-binding NarL/FixJ family response regulator